MTLLNGMIGNETFLQGKYLAVGVNSSGSIGTKKEAPTGYTTDVSAGYLRLGLVGDTDGFGTGKAAMHDSVVRGLAIEGFSIGYKTGSQTYVHSNQELDGLTEIAGQAINRSTATVAEAGWKGATSENLAVDQKIILTDDAKYLRIEVTLTNSSAAAMSDLRYMRTVDPDLGEGFKTINTIVKQGQGGALVTAAASATGNPMFLYANDTRAVVTTGGFINENPYADLVTSAQKVGTVTKTDVSMSINFALGKLDAGQSTTVIFYMGVTNTLTATIAEIDRLGTTAPVPTNDAPTLTDDTLAIFTGATGTGNVLSNDKDANGDVLTASLAQGPSHGIVTLATDGSYAYTANAGYVGSDSFTYSANDGKATSTATVAVQVNALPLVRVDLPDSKLVQNVTTVNGSALAAQTLTGVAQHNSFYIDLDAKSGADKITNFGRDDILVTKGQLFDGNGDGIITLSKSKLGLDGAGSADTVTISGVSALRYLGTDEAGLSVYANGQVKPKGAVEGKIADDVFTGDAGDLKKNVFFFDTGLDVDLGDDRINNFGTKDLLVTTSALSTTALGSSGLVKMIGGSGDLADTLTPGEVGTIDLHGIDGGAVQTLEFDGSIVRSGVAYYVYSLTGSTAGVADLTF